MRCQFGFGGGSRPFVSLDGALTGCFQSWNNDLVRAWKPVMRIPDLKRAVSGPSAPLGKIKFAPNFCYCAVDQEKAAFKRKRAVSGPSALLGPEFLLLCCRPRKNRF